MKTKKFVFNKATVSNLDDVQMQDIRGGAGFTNKVSLCPPTCYTCNIECL